VRSAGLASTYHSDCHLLDSLFCPKEGRGSMYDINFQILVQNLEEYQFTEVKSGHSPVEKFKTEIQEEYKQSGNLEIFKKHRICMGTLNEPDRPANQIQILFPDENVLVQIINSLKLIKRACIFQYYSIKNHGKLFKYHAEPSVGNPRKFSFPHNFLSDAGIRHSYYLSALQKVIGHKLNSVLEIGAGFGGLCNLLAKEKGIHSYYIVDLSENLLIQQYYLCNNGYQVLSWNQRESRNPTIPCVYLLNGEEISELSDQIDLVINTMSMQHMTQMNLDFYFEEINRLNIPYLYLVNRNILRDLSDVKFEDYPIPNSYMNTLLKSVFGKNHLEGLYCLKP